MMKPRTLTLLLLLNVAVLPNLFSQIAVNATGALPDTSAMLDIGSTDKGFLLPRMTTTQRNLITLPATGLAIWNITTNSIEINTGGPGPGAAVWTPLAAQGVVDTSAITNFYLKVQSLISANAPINYINGVVSIPMATGSSDGYLSGADWTTFNGKGSGTVSNIATGYGLSGGAITATGTIIVDSAALSLKYLRITDTANMRLRPVAGTNVTITGTYPDLTFNASASGSGITSIATTAPLTGGTITTTGTIGIDQATASTDGYLSSADWTTFSNAWSRGGNSVAGEQVIGTTTAFDFPFITNGAERMRITADNGFLGIGNPAPTEMLDVTGNLKFSGALKPNNQPGVAGQILKSAGPTGPPTWTAPANQVITFTATGDVSGTASNIATLSPTLTIGDGKVKSTMLEGGITDDKFNSVYLYADGSRQLSADWNTGFKVGVGTAPTALLHIKAGTITAGTAPLKLVSGPVLSTPEVGAFEYLTPQLFFTNGGAKRQEIPQIQQSRVNGSIFSKTGSITLSDITGLTAALVAGKTYKFEANLFITADATGGSKFAIGGTATATNIIYEIVLIDNTSSTNSITSRQTALGVGGSVGQAGTISGFCKIAGLITCNAGGTLTCQFAQNASNGTSSILVGSNFQIQEMP